nr:universal stress protein [Flavisolibacter sp.]
VVGEINEICEKQQPFAVIVGKRGASGVEQFLFGSTALSVIRSSRTPVITVPDTIHEFKLQQVALASDGNFPEEHEGWIRNFLLETRAQFHIVHISGTNADKKDISHILSDLRPEIHSITSEDFSEAIDAFMNNNQVDMLIVLPHKHSMIERLLFKTHTAELIKNISFPVLTIGEG